MTATEMQQWAVEFVSAIEACDADVALTTAQNIEASLTKNFDFRLLKAISEKVGLSATLHSQTALSREQYDLLIEVIRPTLWMKWCVLKSWFDGDAISPASLEQVLGVQFDFPQARREFLACLSLRSDDLAWTVAEFLSSHIEPGEVLPWPMVCLGGDARLATEVPVGISFLWALSEDSEKFDSADVAAALSRAEVVALAQRLKYDDIRTAAVASTEAKNHPKFEFFLALSEFRFFTMALTVDFRTQAAKSKNSVLREIAVRGTGIRGDAPAETQVPLEAWLMGASVREVNRLLRRQSESDAAVTRQVMRKWRYPLDPEVMTQGQLRRRSDTWVKALRGYVGSNAAGDPALRKFDLRVLASPKATLEQIQLVLPRWARWAAQSRVTESARTEYLKAIDDLVQRNLGKDLALQTAACLLASEPRPVPNSAEVSELS